MRTSTITEAVLEYIDIVTLARSQNTARTYRNALSAFLSVLEHNGLDPEDTAVRDLPEDAVAWFATALKDHSPATEALYLTATAGFYQFLAAEQLADPNLPRLRLLIRQRGRRSGQRLPQFPRSSIEKVLENAINLVKKTTDNDYAKLRNYRDRAFLLTLADTGLRVHEICALRRGDLDWNEGRAVIVGKGDHQAVVRFSQRALRAIKDYLEVRQTLDGSSGRPLRSLPLFARHDRGAGKKVKPITTATGRNIVNQRVAETETLGAEAVGTITPHSFRHYFVTTVLRGSGGNLKLAQELARHKNIQVTQRYAHLSDEELDRGYWDIFET
jgi:site-specific recombinase XerD